MNLRKKQSVYGVFSDILLDEFKGSFHVGNLAYVLPRCSRGGSNLRLDVLCNGGSIPLNPRRADTLHDVEDIFELEKHRRRGGTFYAAASELFQGDDIIGDGRAKRRVDKLECRV